MTSVRSRILLLLVSGLCALLLATASGSPKAQAELADDTETMVFGTSVQGRPLVAHHRWGPGDATFRILVVGVIHGDEAVGLDVVELLLSEPLPDGVDLWLVPDANPDGRSRRTRGNANGVDLNRNFPVDWQPYGSDEFTVGGYDPGPEPASEPETLALMELALALQPSYTIWYHQPWDAVVCGSFAGARCLAYATAVDRPTMAAPRPGSATSWQAANGMPAAVVEFGEERSRPPRHTATWPRSWRWPRRQRRRSLPQPTLPSSSPHRRRRRRTAAEPEPAVAPPPPQLGDEALIFVEVGADGSAALVGYVRNGGATRSSRTWHGGHPVRTNRSTG